MRQSDYDKFTKMLCAIGDMKRQPQSPWAIGVWWKALEHYDFAGVEDALIRHVQNPDNGQFMPAPADVIRLIKGNTVDAALVAWAKVDKAVREAGPWTDVVFDDPLIHRVLEDMGGWVGFGAKTDKEWPFVAKEFETRYRGYRTRADLDAYPALLTGVFNTFNSYEGLAQQPPLLIGDPRRASTVMRGGSAARSIGMHLAGAALMAAVPRLEHAAPGSAAKIMGANFDQTERA